MSLEDSPHKPPFLRGQTFVATEQASWLVLRLSIDVGRRGAEASQLRDSAGI